MLARNAIGILFGIFHLAIFPAIVNGQDKTDVTKQRPNIVFMMSDDQAWNGLSVPMHPDLTWSKSAVVDTPNLEKLATQGMRFSAAYAPASVCAPTRISLQTGLSAAALHWTKASRKRHRCGWLQNDRPSKHPRN